MLSRFGVMFFEDPPAAFANLARAAAPGGRLHVAVWAERPPPLFELPLQVALRTLWATRGSRTRPPTAGRSPSATRTAPGTC